MRDEHVMRTACGSLDTCVLCCSTETDEHILQTLLELVYQLLCDGELKLACAMRKKVLEKCEYHKQKQEASHRVTLMPEFPLTAK